MRITFNDWQAALDFMRDLKIEPPVPLYAEVQGRRIYPSSRGRALSKIDVYPQNQRGGTGRFVVTDKPTGDVVFHIRNV